MIDSKFPTGGASHVEEEEEGNFETVNIEENAVKI